MTTAERYALVTRLHADATDVFNCHRAAMHRGGFCKAFDEHIRDAMEWRFIVDACAAEAHRLFRKLQRPT